MQKDPGTRLVFTGVVMDAKTLTPLPNSQISINRVFTAISDRDGGFSFLVSKKDTVVFTLLGYRPATIFISDTLSGREFTAGVFMRTDTVTIGEVIILPRKPNLKYDILNAPVIESPQMQNAKNNVDVAGYQGKVTQGELGEPMDNYRLIHHRNRLAAFDKGIGIPADRLLPVSPLIVIPGTIYLLRNGLPQSPPPLVPDLSESEIREIRQKYLESQGLPR